MARVHRRDLLPLLLLLVPLGARAQVAAAELSAADQADLARITAYLNSLTTIKGKFLQIAPDGSASQGIFWLERPGRMRFQYDPPSPYLLVAGHGLLIFHDSSLGQTTNIPLSSSPLSLLLAPRITLSGKATVTEFRRLPGELDVTLVRTATPRQGSLTLSFSTEPLRLRRWAIRDAQDKVTRVSLYDMTPGGHFDQDLFSYVPPPRRNLQ